MSTLYKSSVTELLGRNINTMLKNAREVSREQVGNDRIWKHMDVNGDGKADIEVRQQYKVKLEADAFAPAGTKATVQLDGTPEYIFERGPVEAGDDSVARLSRDGTITGVESWRDGANYFLGKGGDVTKKPW